MSINYEWTTANPHLIMGNDNNTVILEAIHWVRTATEGSTSVNSYGTVRLGSLAVSMTHAAYEELNQDDVLELLNKSVNSDSIDNELAAKLEQTKRL
jgi:hypothetical protein